MSKERFHDDDDRSDYRQQNRALRKVNRSLRNRERELRQKADEYFLALCEQDRQAELAFEELWASGEFDCGPQDHAFMIEQSIQAMRIVKAMKIATAAETQRQDQSPYAQKVRQAIF